jgi:DNA recombination protein RmuC
MLIFNSVLLVILLKKIMDIIYLLTGLAIGLVVGVLYMRNNLKSKILEASNNRESELNVLKEDFIRIDKRKEVLENSLNEKQQMFVETEKKLQEETVSRQNAEMLLAKIKSEKENLLADTDKLELALKELNVKYDKLSSDKLAVEKNNIILKEENKSLHEKLENERKQLEDIQKKFKDEFENLAHKILKDNTVAFNTSSTKNIGELLNPLKEKLQSFEQKVENTYEKGLKDQSDLKAELKRLHELSLKLDQDARNLTNALKSDTKKQGNWGEMILERVLERSGLQKNQEYFVQQTARDVEGKMLRPDVVVKLPDDKHLIIDSKVSLTAYTQFVSEDDGLNKDAALKLHLASVKKHVKELSAKSYDSLSEFNSPDFVLMFMPIEPAFAVAVQNDPELFNYAWKERVVIVSPTTLLATLRTVASIWKYEKQNQNALEIAERGGKLYDKFVNFVKDLDAVGANLQRASKSYDDAQKKLSSGSGNILRQVEQLKKMGVNTKNSLPEKYMIDNE